LFLHSSVFSTSSTCICTTGWRWTREDQSTRPVKIPLACWTIWHLMQKIFVIWFFILQCLL